MPNPLLSSDRFGAGTAPPTEWPPPPPTWGSAGAGPGQAPSGPPIPPLWPTLTREGVTRKTAGLLALVVVGAAVGWSLVVPRTALAVVGGQVVEVQRASFPGVAWVAAVLAFVLVGATWLKPEWAKYVATPYALLKGVFVGALSHVYEARYDGIVLQALGLTLGVFLVMLVLYRTGAIRVTPRLRQGVIAATLAVFAIYLLTIVAHIFGGSIPYIHDAGPIGILFSLAVVTIAALNLTLDFDFVDRAADLGARRDLEWNAALGLVVTLVWLYIELVRLLAKLRSR